jgi:BolA-like protein 1
MLPHEIKNRIETSLETTEVLVTEFSGGTDHYSVVVVSTAFENKPLLKRHRMVMDAFQAEIGTGEVHALSIKAYTPDQWDVEKTKLRFY